MKVRSFFAVSFALMLAVAGCDDNMVPKPKGYFRIELPQAEYARFDSAGLPYSFDVQQMARVVPDDSRLAEKDWVNIIYKRLNCKVHITYRDISKNAEEALEDNRKLAYKHTVKADAIGEQYFSKDGVYGVLYTIKGDAATPIQFALTDSVSRIFRGSVYFNSRPNADSLAPVVRYLEADIVRLMESFKFKKPF